MNRVSFFAALLSAAILAVPAQAFEWDTFANPDASVRACLEKALSAENLEILPKGRPEDKNLRKSAKKAYRDCACVKRSHNYAGPVFDAMAQIDETVDMPEAIKMVRSAKVAKLALFARSRKYLGENEKQVLELRKNNPELIVLGAPKYFLHNDDLADDFIQSTLEGVWNKGYRFVGEILYTHADKERGEQTAAGERYFTPLGPGTRKLLNGLKKSPVPLMTHWEAYAWKRDRPRFGRLYRRNPKQIFIFPHMGFGSAEQISDVLREYPNVYATISKKDTDKGGLYQLAKRIIDAPMPVARWMRFSMAD